VRYRCGDVTIIRPYSKAEVSFLLGKEIGHEGSNSETYIAHDHQLDAEIVIKKVAKSSLESVDQYFEESRVLYLSAHPNVVQVLYASQDPTHIYIAMPYYRKGSLNALIGTRYLTTREIVSLGCQIAAGLHNIHSKGLVHFDVKPDNVLLSDRGEALVSDFGLSRRIGTSGTAGQDRLYFKMCPPESYKSYEHDCRFDVYQLGLTLYRMCAGNAEFYEQFESFGKTQNTFDRNAFQFAVRNGRFPDIDRLPEHIPARLRTVIKDCLEADPSKRLPSAISVANGLAPIDDKLDWQYSKSTSSRKWVRRSGDMEYRIEVSSDGSSCAQKGKAGGKLSRITEYCRPDITTSTLKKFLKEI
jgi:serine/threonine protein kinase